MPTPLPTDIVTIFAKEASERFADTTLALAALDTDLHDVAALELLKQRFHSFAGVCGLEGFEVINSLGARGESDCRRLLAAAEAPTAEHVRRWRSILDVMHAEVEEMKRAVQAEVPETAAQEPYAPVRRIYDILLVDDDLVGNAILAGRLEQEGYNVNIAVSRAEALQCLTVQRPHALLVEASLDDGSGYEVIEQLRALPDGENAVILLMSRGGAFLDRVEAIRAGADGAMSKPVDCDRLLDRLRSLVLSRDESVARILSVEDDATQAAYLTTVLEDAGYAVRSCSDPSRFEAEMAAFAPDLILMDILLPGISGYELAGVARQSDEHQATPILFLTTQGQMHTRIQSMRSGGDDHIVKPVSPNLLLAAVESRIARARQLRQFLDRDNLTGLYNRASFLRRVKARIRRAEDRPASLVLLDVDRFKLLNDGHGHAFGDEVLAKLALFLRKHVRVSDSVGRHGGEEFTMLIDDVAEEDAVRLLNRLREEFAAIPHPTPSGGSIFVTFSAGVTALPRNVDELYRAFETADANLYRAKAEGRNRAYGSEPRYPARISA